jgi:[1-hydroxy-2-(trimethylamino)ethyl]phosphonate dioxygenase
VTPIIGEIFDLFTRFGSEGYGEDLSIEKHMLQSAAMAQSQGATDSVVVAALLHDIGYFLHADDGAEVSIHRNFGHESVGAAWLSQAFGEDVTAPIALHVEAKRYLCAVEPGYFDRLSDASKISLALQGGVMDEGEVAAFARHPHVEAALILRRCDDLGKDVSLHTRNVEDYRGLLEAALR